jgi:large conductance mechanosensitive channel
MVKEFKEFAMRGNVIDLAVGVIIGAAFGKIVSSLVSDILMPPIGLIVGGLDFATFAVVLKEAAEGSPAVLLRYGLFINAAIDFIIVAFSIFLFIKGMNSMKKKESTPAPAAPTTKDCPECLMSIPINAKRCGHCTAVLK